MRRSRRQIVSYVLCVLVFAGTMVLALRLSHPPDTRPRIRHIGSNGSRAVHVETENDVLSVQVGREKYEYQLLQTENGLAAAELPRDGR